MRNDKTEIKQRQEEKLIDTATWNITTMTGKEIEVRRIQENGKTSEKANASSRGYKNKQIRANKQKYLIHGTHGLTVNAEQQCLQY